VAGSGRDRITDFNGAEGDRIDLSGDRRAQRRRPTTLHAGDRFTKVAGQLVVTGDPVAGWVVKGDVNGDGSSDFVIMVTSATALVATDFIL
jgi:hypothetical protein